MDILEIKKEGNKNFFHYWESSSYGSSDYGIQVFNNKVTVSKLTGASVFLSDGFEIANVKVYDIGGSEEVYTNGVDLQNRLIELGYNAFFEDGDVDLSAYALKANVVEKANTTPYTPSLDYEPATKKYVDDNAGSGTGIFYQNKIDEPKETPDAIDDEFNTNKIDSTKWTIIKGDIGVVDIFSETLDGSNSIIDMTTISDSLLVQTANGKDFEMYQDFTLLDGESIILNMNAIAQMTQTDAGFISCGMCLGDGSTALTGNYIATKFSSNPDGWWMIKEITSEVVSGAWGNAGDEPAVAAKDIYYKISKIGSKYQVSYSLSGKNWMIGNYLTTIAGTQDKLFLFSRSTATQTGSPLPVIMFNWLRKGDNIIKPWNNNPTNPPIIIVQSQQAMNEYVTFKYSAKISQSDLVTGNFSLLYSQNGDDVTSVSISNILDSTGSVISEDTDEIRCVLSYSGDSTGLGTYTITSENLTDIYGNVLITETSQIFTLNSASYTINADPNVLANWEAGTGDNNTISPYSKTDSKNSEVLLSFSGSDPSLTGDFWSFTGTQGFKNSNASILSAFSSANRDCQIHYIASFNAPTGIMRAAMFADNINNKYNNFFYQNGSDIDFSIGSTGSTYTNLDIYTFTPDTPYLFSVKFYQDGLDTKMDCYINDGTTDVYSLTDVNMNAYPAPALTGFYWSMRETSGGVDYFTSKLKTTVISESSNFFDDIRTLLIAQV